MNGRRRRTGWMLLASLAWLALLAMPGRAAAALSITEAQARLAPEGLPAQTRRVDLNQRWDVLFPGRGGTASYRLALPPYAGQEPMALLFTRVGNQAHIRVNGVTLLRLGLLGDAEYDAGKAAQLLLVPAAVLRADAANELQVDVTLQRQRWGGLSQVLYGTQAEVRPEFERLRWWRQTASAAFAASLAVMGGLAALLWWRQREALYGCFALAAWLGTVRNIDQVWPEVPVPWPLWGMVAAVAYAWHLALICRFTLIALGPVPAAMRQANNVVLALSGTLAVASFVLAMPVLWTLGLATLVPLAVVTVGFIVRDAWRGGRPIAWVLVGAGLISVAAGVHDLVFLRAGHSSGIQVSVTPHAMFVFVVIMATMVAERYSRYVADYRRLNRELAERVAARETELQLAFDALQAQRREQAVTLERQRLMREIHDGVGSHLVGLLNMVHQRESDPAVLEEQVRMALDEMRIAIDSLQPVHGDLTTVLATLRYRLQPRLQAAGITLQWNVDELPPLPELSPQLVMQVQRILLEAFTNVLKHARATRIEVRASGPAPGERGEIELSLTDDGIGLPAGSAAPQSRGLLNMHHRAQAIGALLNVEAVAPHGTRVTLRWPQG